MHYVAGYLFLALLAPITSHSQTVNQAHCENMYARTCPSEGQSIEERQIEALGLDKKILELRPETTGRFFQVLESDDHTYFRRMSIALVRAGKPDSFPECGRTDRASFSLCNRQVAHQLSLLAASKFNPAVGKNLEPAENLDLESLDAVTSNENFRNVLSFMNDRISPALNTESTNLTLVTEIFPEAKRRLIAVLQRMNIPDSQKQILIEKVRSIQPGNRSCMGGDYASISVVDDLYANANYMNSRNSFNFCQGFLLLAPDRHSLLFVMAHELAHSIDPCGYESIPSSMGIENQSNFVGRSERLYPATKLLSCLRNRRSIDATRRPLSSIVAPIRIAKDISPLCFQDQIGEATADWFATEVLSDSIKENKLNPIDAATAVGNVFWFGCPQSGNVSDNWREHPQTERRVNRLLMQNPTLRQSMGCGPSQHYGYCDGNSEDPVVSPRPPETYEGYTPWSAQ